MSSFILIILVILFLVYCLKSQEILNFIENICKKHQNKNFAAKLIISFIGYSSLQILNSIIIVLFIALIVIFSLLDIFKPFL